MLCRKNKHTSHYINQAKGEDCFMASGFYGVQKQIIKDDEIEKLKLPEWAKFKETLDSYGINIHDYARAVEIGDTIIAETGNELSDDEQHEVHCSYQNFINAFKQRTGIGIFINHHDSENEGDVHDDIDGAFFELDSSDIYQLTPQAKKLIEEGIQFESAMIVKFG